MGGKVRVTVHNTEGETKVMPGYTGVLWLLLGG